MSNMLGRYRKYVQDTSHLTSIDFLWWDMVEIAEYTYRHGWVTSENSNQILRVNIQNFKSLASKLKIIVK